MEEVGRGPVGLDSAVFIYFIEEHRRFLPLIAPLFEAVDRGALPAVTSSLTLLEVLVVPYRAANLPLAERYEALLTRSRGLSLIELDRTLLRAAAQIRAVHPTVRAPDALQLGAAVAGGCSAFVTNDRDLPELGSLRVLQLSGFTGSS